MNKKIRLNTMHRYVGIIVAPFLVLQTISGVILDFGLFRRPGAGVAPELLKHSRLDQLLIKLHFGPGLVDDTYHVLLGLSLLWMAVSGWALYLRLRRLKKAAKAAKP